MSVEKFIQIERSPRRALLAAMVVIAAVGLYRWIVSPFNVQLQAAQHYDSTLDMAVRKTQALGEELKVKKAKADELSGLFARRRNELFTPNEVREFFAELPAVARLAGCAIQSVSSVADARVGTQDQPAGDSGVVGKKVVVTVIGGYGNITEFLKKLQTSEHKVWIESVRLDAGAAGRLQCQITLAMYCVEKKEIG